MPTTTTFECANCDKRRTVVAASDAAVAEIDCPDCDGPFVVRFGTD